MAHAIFMLEKIESTPRAWVFPLGRSDTTSARGGGTRTVLSCRVSQLKHSQMRSVRIWSLRSTRVLALDVCTLHIHLELSVVASLHYA